MTYKLCVFNENDFQSGVPLQEVSLSVDKSYYYCTAAIYNCKYLYVTVDDIISVYELKYSEKKPLAYLKKLAASMPVRKLIKYKNIMLLA